MATIPHLRSGLLALVLTVAAMAPASAHAPYPGSSARITLPDGSPGRMALWYGDGFLGADPVRAEIRSAAGAILAWTPTGVAASLACAEGARPEDCRAFVFDHGLWPAVWVPDPAGFRVGARPEPPYEPEEWTGAFPATAGQTTPTGFRRADSVATQAWGIVLLVLSRWAGLLLSAALIAAACLALGAAVRAGTAVRMIALGAVATGLFCLAAFQAIVLVLLIGFPAGLLAMLWLLGGLGWLGFRAVRARPLLRPGGP